MQKTDGEYWAACQVFSTRGHLAREEIEKLGHGTFVPTYVQRKYVAGKEFAKECPLLPGYLFFKTRADEWSHIGDVENVLGVLATEGRASRIRDEEIRQMLVDHATGAHDRIEAPHSGVGRYSKRRRRPRPGKRMRATANG